MPRHVDWEVGVPLANVAPSAIANRAEYFKIVHDHYTTQYLEGLGVEPTDRRRKLVARGAPLVECEIEAEWGDGSALAQRLRIAQPMIGRNAGAFNPVRVAETEGTRLSLEAKLGYNRACISAVPPDVCDAATVSQRVAPSGSFVDTKEAAQRERERMYFDMQIRDMEGSRGNHQSLTEELECKRRRARRGEADDRDKVLVEWGVAGELELAELKRKFILPFAAERQSKDFDSVVLVPWQSPELMENPWIQPLPDYLPEFLEPPAITLESIYSQSSWYVEEALPLELLTNRKDPQLFANLRERLTSPEATRLIGLLAHLLYWTVFGHLHPPEKRISDQTRQSLVLTLQELWIRLVDPIKRGLGRRGELLARDSPAGICFVMPVFVLAIKRAVDKVYLTQYTKPLQDPDHGAVLNDRITEQLNVLVMNLFDPDCSYASFGTLDSSVKAIKLWRKYFVVQMRLGQTPATRMLCREFRTTPMVLMLMNSDGEGPGNPLTRKHLQKSQSDPVLRAAVGIAPPSEDAGAGTPGGFRMSERESLLKHACLDEGRRSALYRTARKRLQLSGSDVANQKMSKNNGDIVTVRRHNSPTASRPPSRSPPTTASRRMTTGLSGVSVDETSKRGAGGRRGGWGGDVMRADVIAAITSDSVTKAPPS